MIELDKRVLSVVRAKATPKSAAIALLVRRPSLLALELAAAGHRVFVLSDRFLALRRTSWHAKERGLSRPILLEADLDRLPLAPASLDFAIVEHGLPRRPDAFALVRALRALLRPGGWLIAPHPSAEGPTGVVERVASLSRPGIRPPLERHKVSGLLMRAGYGDIGQESVRHRLRSFSVTTGRVGKFFDRNAEPVLFFFSDVHRTRSR
ncbi:MAG: class I SAM-dependent methyltransferase [Myxococcota bacterium]|jgi:SAM-dependent methyltransferase|nr:class I SAM-dependent methyltransferase [Myxococcota bacterium]